MTDYSKQELPVPLQDRYQSLSRLGQRPGRETWLVLERQTNQQVVIKLLSLEPDFDWTYLKLFERESVTLQNLMHPSIPQYLDFMEFQEPTRQGFALVQTYVEAQSLQQQ